MRLELDTSSDTILSFLESKGVNVESCYAVSSSANESKFVRMRVCVPNVEVRILYDSDIWPVGVVVRSWRFKSQSQLQPQRQDVS